jgi:uncharacterized protein (TIGR04551 family)
MRRWLLIIVPSLLVAGTAWAQFGPGGGMGGGMRPMGQGPQGPQKEQEEGPAEQAPENQGQEPALQPLPAWPGQRDKQLQFFQIDGYMRGRAYLFHNFNLGIPLGTSGPQPANPIFVPFSEVGASGNSAAPGTMTSCAARNGAGSNCRTDNITSADMRFRIEPTINIGDKMRVRSQIDIFDNYVLGSTPDGYYINGLNPPRDVPLSAFSRSQAPQMGQVNSITDAIRVKRAWAEIGLPIGELWFGRMPSQWGAGMLVNSGDCFDCDYGTNADRVMFRTGGPKLKNFFLALLWDWVATGPTTALIQPSQAAAAGPVYNADTLDDVSQWGGAIGRLYSPTETKDMVERGEVVMSYGGYFIYRQQDWDEITNPGANMPGGALLGQTPVQLQKNLTPRHAWAFIPDLWFKLDYKKLHIEAEAALISGKIGNVSDQISTSTQPLTILQFGGMARGDYKLLHDSLHLAFEVGYASGDQAEDPNAVLNFRTAQIIRPPTQTRITNFNFDPDYHVDLILFRRIIGTVTNATYFKPSVWYDILDQLSARVDVIYSIANQPVSYPGNSMNLGLELDGSVMYHNDREGFYAGIAYGVLFPFGALNIPAAIYGTPLAHDAEAAQTVQARVVVKF